MTPARRGAAMPAAELALVLARSERLSRRRFEMLPLYGPGAAFTDPQGRAPGESTAPAALVELISSIATVGVLQPILVEELESDGYRLVAGERRLRAAKWGALNLADNPNFGAIPAVICPGPLSEEERRVWQLVENLAREDLRPGELAAALLYERSALLTSRLLAAGISVPAEVAGLEDPVARFRALDRVRLEAGASQLGAPWDEVLARLGLQIGRERARQLVRAFRALPVELSTDMDEAGVTLATRLDFVRLERGGRRDAARELWAAVKSRGRPDLLPGAIRERRDHPEFSPNAAIEASAARRERANEARAQSQRRDMTAVTGPATSAEPALQALRALLAELRAGATPSRYDAGSLRLYADELLGLLDAPPKEAAA